MAFRLLLVEDDPEMREIITDYFIEKSDLIFNTNDYWRCSYTERREGNRSYMGYAYLNPKGWFSEKDITELENYLTSQPKVKNPGELAGYSVVLEGFWVDNEMIIPDKISVTAMYANTLDEEGNVSSASGSGDEQVYVSGYQNTKGLPYFEHGSIHINENVLRNGEEQTKLRNMVLDQEKLKETVKLLPHSDYGERLNFLTYRYYISLPYRNAVKVTDDQDNYSEFWTVIARDVDLWERCAGTLALWNHWNQNN